MSILRGRTIVACALITACMNWGTRPEGFPPALGPEGARVALRVRGETADRVGELMAADSGGITIRIEATGRVVRVAWARVDALDVKQLDDEFRIRFGEPVTPEKRARLALVSRFPQGMDRLPITIDSLIAEATRSTSRFRERRVAVEEGYRPIGPDFPGMGEHWVNGEAMLVGRVDPARPAFLTYATIDGRPVLLGVGFAVVTPGREPTVGVPGWPAAWHEHSGLLADEALGIHSTTRGETGGTHMWVMHVWTVLRNPRGPTEAENWALPYVRAGLEPPDAVDDDAARALSLSVGGDAFLRDLLTDAGVRTPTTAPAIDSLIDLAATGVRADRAAGARRDALRARWLALSANLARATGTDLRSLLASSHAGGHHDP